MTIKPDIYVDLDGSLIRSDMLVEGIVKLVLRNPLYLALCVLWAFQGRYVLKKNIANATDIEEGLLPFNKELLTWLNTKKAEGHSLILATVSYYKNAQSVADHLGIFDSVLASKDNINLKAKEKLKAIQEHAGDMEFIYIGDSKADRVIWERSCQAVLVNAAPKEIKFSKKLNNKVELLGTRPSQLRAFIQSCRLHQWVKNILVFVPLLALQTGFNTGDITNTLIAFFLFSLCASGVYLLNDLYDLEYDRAHKTKSLRPIAAGILDIKVAILGSAVLPVTSFVLALELLPLTFLWVLAGYYSLTAGYSFIFKKRSTVDVVCLSLLYLMRILAGAAAISITPSSWLLGFSFFVFTGLAYLKRYVEVDKLSNDDTVKGRGYAAQDKTILGGLGIASSTTSILVLGLFIQDVSKLGVYQSPAFLWVICILVFFWNNRIWLGAARGKVNEDPVVFALKDGVSIIVGVLAIAAVLLARYY